MVRVGDWVQPEARRVAMAGTLRQWTSIVESESASWDDAWANATDPSLGGAVDQSATPKARVYPFTAAAGPGYGYANNSMRELTSAGASEVRSKVTVVAVDAVAPIWDVWPDEVPAGATVEFDRSEASWTDIRWTVTLVATATYFGNGVDWVDLPDVYAGADAGVVRVRTAPRSWVSAGDTLDAIPTRYELNALPVAATVGISPWQEGSHPGTALQPVVITGSVMDGTWLSPAITMTGPWHDSPLPEPPTTVRPQDYRSLSIGVVDLDHTLDGLYLPPRYRIIYPSSGRYTLRQRQTLTGSDGWPLRQRQNGGNSGTWPLRQRQTGV